MTMTTNMGPTTTSPNDYHPLLLLPPEIRNQIYDYLFPWQRCNYFNPALALPIERGLNMCTCLHGTPLFRVCRQFRAETLPIFYTNHTIRLALFRKDQHRVESWIKSIGDDAIAHMRRVHIRGFPSEPASDSQVCMTFASTSSLMMYLDTSERSAASARDGGVVACYHRSNVRGSRDSAERVKKAAEDLAEETRKVMRGCLSGDERGILTTEKIEQIFEIAGWT